MAWKAKVAVLPVPPGPESMFVSGGIVSTVKLRVAGVGSVLPAESVARTENVCRPSGSALYATPETQAVNGAPSRLQANVEPVSVELKPNEALVLFTVPDGPEVIVVSGGVRSIVQLRLAGDGSVRLVAGSVEATVKVWEPSARPL